MWRILWTRSRQQLNNRKPPRFRPRIEILEDRCLPSTLTVTTTNDSGPGSLRAEIAASHSGDTINFAPSLTNQTIRLTSGELAVTKSLTIEQANPGLVVIDGNFASRIFDVGGSASVSLDNLEIQDGAASDGGGIKNNGSLTLNQCFLRGNFAFGTLAGRQIVGGEGGAVDNRGTMTINESSAFLNTAFGSGGAITNHGTITMTDSFCNGNLAGKDGGAIANLGAFTATACGFGADSCTGSGGEIANFGTAVVCGSTISFGGSDGNVSFGGGISNAGTMTITASAVNGVNSAYFAGGGIYNTGILTLSATTVTGNRAMGGGGVYNTGTLYVTNGSSITGNSFSTGGESDLYNVGTVFISSDSTVGVIGP
jgi:hypothetical protein